MLNNASRSRSAVGRIACDFGVASVRPRRRPPTTRITGPAGATDAGRTRGRARHGGRGSRGELVSLHALASPRAWIHWPSGEAAAALPPALAVHGVRRG